MDRTRYLKADIIRLFKNYPVYLAVLGVAASFWFSLEKYAFEERLVNGNVFDTYWMAAEMSGIVIAYAFCAFSYATVFCEDLEKKYLRYSINRGNMCSYVISKAVVIYGASVLTMVLGTLLFVGSIRLRIPWLEADEEVDVLGMYQSLVLGEHYWGYIFLCAVQMGMLAGVLALASSFFSLFVSNKMFILVTPVLIHQILMEYRSDGWLNIMLINPKMNRFSTDIQYFLIVLGCSLSFSILLTWGIYKKLKERL